MNISITRLLEKVKAIDFKHAVYPVILSALAIATVVLFVGAVQFFSSNINAVLTVEDTSAPRSALDLTNFNLLKNKLGIQTTSSAKINVSATTSSTASTTSSTTNNH